MHIPYDEALRNTITLFFLPATFFVLHLPLGFLTQVLYLQTRGLALLCDILGLGQAFKLECPFLVDLCFFEGWEEARGNLKEGLVRNLKEGLVGN
jgi:hypothetical protein